MTDIRVKGFDTKRQLDQYLGERDDTSTNAEMMEPVDGNELRRSSETELAWLQKEVAELRDRLSSFAQSKRNEEFASGDRLPWLPIVMIACATFCIGEFAVRLRSR